MAKKKMKVGDKKITLRKIRGRLRKVLVHKTGRNKYKVSVLTRLKAKRSFGKRLGQTKGVGYPKGYYVKAGILHHYDLERDKEIKSERKRKKSDPPWRGDLPGKRV